MVYEILDVMGHFEVEVEFFEEVVVVVCWVVVFGGVVGES